MSNLIVHRINTHYMIGLNQFCEGDKDIENCRMKLEHEVFTHDWFVAWFDHEGLPFYKLPLFNKPYFKEALRRFYTKAYDFIQRFGFLGYYHIKDIDTWMLEVSKSKTRITKQRYNNEEEDDEEEEEEEEIVVIEEEIDIERQLRENILASFPFGVIPLGQNGNDSYGSYMVIENRNTIQSTIVFECNDDDLAANYEFNVIDRGARFRSTPYGTDFISNNFMNAQFGEDYIPISPFEELRRQKDLVIEGERTLFDSNSMIVYPENIAYVKPQKDQPLEDLSDDTLFSLNSILQARSRDNYDRQDQALDDARCQLQRTAMKRTVTGIAAGGRRGCGGSVQMQQPSTLIWDYKKRDNRPSAYEAVRCLPAPIEINGTRPGQPVVNVAERERKYENDVCTVMRLPYVFFKPHGIAGDSSSSSKTNHSSLGSGNTAHNDMYQKLLDKEVSGQHGLFNELLTEVYYHTFRKLDKQLFQLATDPNFFDGTEVGIQFNHNIVKSDDAIMGLIKFYEAGIVHGDVIRRLVYKNYSIPLLPEDEIDELSPKRRRVEIV